MTPVDPAESRKMAAVGMFDGVHRGHRSLISELRQQARLRGLEPVAFTFTAHPMAVIAPQKCPPMLSSAEERCAMLREAGAAEATALDFAAIRGLTAAGFMAMLRDTYSVDALLMGFNNHIGSDRLTTPEEYRQAGAEAAVEVLFAEEYRGEGAPCSSSVIRSDIAAGNVDDAAIRLGRPYTVSGEVIGGRQLGRTIGFPTANLLSRQELLPANGVYAADTEIDGHTYRTIVNIGHRPTVDIAGAPVSIEAHLIGYSGDLYGHTLHLDMLRRLRDERRFGSVDALAAQLRADAACALGI